MLARLKANQETTPSRVPYAGPTRTAVARQPSLSLALPKSQFILNPEFFQTSLKHKNHSPSSAPAHQQFQRGHVALGLALMGLLVLCQMEGSDGLRFVIDREECFSHDAKYQGDTIHVSFVVIKVDSSWHNTEDGVDLVIKGPSGEQINDIRDKTSEKFEFVVQKQGVHQFCFTNKSPYHETIDFDVHAAHFTYYDQHAKDEHFAPLLEQIAKLEEALFNIQFEQHWLEAETDRQAIVNEGMSRRATHKALVESGALIGVSILQVVLLKRLFERKLGSSRV
ncbi:PREDICTED: transmembrane emp24 [Prunus dulcis]|uniref:PREDICTED: transmembrane emp24 n=1 Tax=Prunus dulcis TaxID=3755 RepID=A0A5E4FGY9_PRUDU|nr:PREDICTED: transmembrane emp24 [Prunus dulcis]